MPFVLPEDREVLGLLREIRSGHEDLIRRRQAQQKIRECVSAELAVEGERAELVGCAKIIDPVIFHLSKIGAELHRVLPFDPGKIVAELGHLGGHRSYGVVPEVRKASSTAEIEPGE